jgi:hypothetical protein
MLNDCLSKSISLPTPLPPRKITGNLDAEFIAQRRLLSAPPHPPLLHLCATTRTVLCNICDFAASAALEAYLQAIVHDTVVINAKEFRAFIDSNLDASSRCLLQPLRYPS